MMYFGPERYNINVHLVSHLPEKVKLLGPLWSYSLYQYESHNRVMLNSFRVGSRGLLKQIAERSQMAYCMAQLYTNFIIQTDTLKNKTIAETVWLRTKNKNHITHSKPILVENLHEMELFKQPNFSDIKKYLQVNTMSPQEVQLFDRIVYKGVPFTTFRYKQHLQIKKVDCYFYSEIHQTFGRIDTIVATNNIYFAIFKSLNLINDSSDSLPPNFDLLRYMRRYNSTSTKFYIIPFTDVSRKCISIRLSDESSIICFESNSHEGS